MLHVVHSIIFQKPTEPPAENQMTYQYEILSAMCKIIKCVISHLLIDSIKHFTWKIPYRRLLATGNIIFPSCIWGIKCITLFTLSTFFTSSKLSSLKVSFENMQDSGVVPQLVASLTFFLATYSFLPEYWIRFSFSKLQYFFFLLFCYHNAIWMQTFVVGFGFCLLVLFVWVFF